MMTTENTWVEAETLHPDEAFQKVVENVAQKAEVEAMVSAYDKPAIITAFRAIIPELTATELAQYDIMASVNSDGVGDFLITINLKA